MAQSLLRSGAVHLTDTDLTITQVNAFIERSLTNEAVTKLAKQLAAGKGQKKALDGLWSELEGAGAVKRGAFVQLRVKKPKGGAAPVDAQDGES